VQRLRTISTALDQWTRNAGRRLKHARPQLAVQVKHEYFTAAFHEKLTTYTREWSNVLILQ